MRTHSLSCLGPHGFHRIVYREWGEPDHPHVVVCVHGLTRNSRDFDPLAAHLAKRRRVICPDIAGRGESPWLPHPGDYGYPLYLSDMAALIARAGVETVDWVGTSMGGLIGMFLAAQPGNPIRRLVMNDVGPLVPKAALERLASYVGVDPAFDGLPQLEQYLRQICAPFGPLTDAQWQHLARHSARQRDHGKLASPTIPPSATRCAHRSPTSRCGRCGAPCERPCCWCAAPNPTCCYQIQRGR